ncbi:hypothetical protein ECC02_004868 [Trypanosoma cruzi]|uniref:Uncharacterized protein n=1 Tax=Trypanosoma cruzi TaxID=5693 RepID=A0A7J6Y5R5_TRYCR|nr:hypothetical protein ECC02_004868 [Trypanosoma cruzi]
MLSPWPRRMHSVAHGESSATPHSHDHSSLTKRGCRVCLSPASHAGQEGSGRAGLRTNKRSKEDTAGEFCRPLVGPGHSPAAKMNNSKTQERPACVGRRGERARPRPQHSSHGHPRTHWVTATSHRLPASEDARGCMRCWDSSPPSRSLRHHAVAQKFNPPAHKYPLSHASQAQKNKYTHCPFFRSEERSGATTARCYHCCCAASRECGADGPCEHHSTVARRPPSPRRSPHHPRCPINLLAAEPRNQSRRGRFLGTSPSSPSAPAADVGSSARGGSTTGIGWLLMFGKAVHTSAYWGHTMLPRQGPDGGVTVSPSWHSCHASSRRNRTLSVPSPHRVSTHKSPIYLSSN